MKEKFLTIQKYLVNLIHVLHFAVPLPLSLYRHYICTYLARTQYLGTFILRPNLCHLQFASISADWAVFIRPLQFHGRLDSRDIVVKVLHFSAVTAAGDR